MKKKPSRKDKLNNNPIKTNGEKFEFGKGPVFKRFQQEINDLPDEYFRVGIKSSNSGCMVLFLIAIGAATYLFVI